jgi:hypothetical protein
MVDLRVINLLGRGLQSPAPNQQQIQTQQALQSKGFTVAPRRRSSSGGSVGGSPAPQPPQFQSSLLQQSFRTREEMVQAEQAELARREQARIEAEKQRDRLRFGFVPGERGTRQDMTSQDFRMPEQVQRDTTPQRRTAGEVFRTFRQDPSTILPTLAKFTRRQTTDRAGDFLIDKSTPLTDAMTRAERDRIAQIEREIKSIEKDVESFNRKFGDKELPEDEFEKSERERERLLSRIESVEKKVDGLPSDLRKAAKSSPLFERFSVASTRAVGGAIAGTGALIRGVGRPVETFGGTPDIDLKESARIAVSDPVGTGLAVGTTVAVGFGIGGFIARLTGRVSRLARASRTAPKVTVSVGNIKITKVRGAENQWRVSGTATGSIRNPSTGASLGTVRSSTETVVVTAPTREGARRAFVDGVSGALTSQGGRGALSISAGRVTGRIEFDGKVGVGRVRFDEGIGGTTTRKGDLFIGPRLSSPTPVALRTREVARIDTPKGSNLIVDTGAVFGRPIRITTGLEGFRARRSRPAAITVERDTVRVIDNILDSRPGKRITPSPGKKTRASDTEQIIMTDKQIAQSVGVSVTRASAQKAAKKLAKEIRGQQGSQAIVGKTLQAQRRAQVTGIVSMQTLRQLPGKRNIFGPTSMAGISSLSGVTQAQPSRLIASQRLFSPSRTDFASPSPPNFGRAVGGALAGLPLAFRFDGPRGLPGLGIGKAAKKTKGTPDFTPSLGAIVKGDRRVVTAKEFEKLRKQQFGGFEIRPVVTVKNKVNKGKKGLNKLFDSLF